jgi:hypothetical protein
MKALLIVAIAIVALVVWFSAKGKSRSNTIDLSVRNKKYNDDYEIWLDIFKKEKSNIKEFDLYGTKAAIAWNDGDSEAVVICITAFTNQEPTTKKWDHFEFDIKDKYWTSVTPRGSASRIREELASLGLS